MIRTTYPVPHGAQVLATFNPPIPPITDPMGKSWRQPDPENFVIDDTHVIMSQRDFDQLAEYSTSNPSGVYPGKCWKAERLEFEGRGFRRTGQWFLRWFGESEIGPGYCSNHQREIIIV